MRYSGSNFIRGEYLLYMPNTLAIDRTYPKGTVLGDVHNIWTLNLNLNVQLACWDILSGHFPDTTYVWICLLLLILLLGLSFWLLRVHAHISRCWEAILYLQVSYLLSSLCPDVTHPTALIGHHPNHHTRNAAKWRKGSVDYTIDACGCRLHILIEQWVYTLPGILGLHYNIWGRQWGSPFNMRH